MWGGAVVERCWLFSRAAVPSSSRFVVSSRCCALQPAWEPPELPPQPEPTPYTAPALPQWVNPGEPPPCGFLRGTSATVFFDVSGTLSPRLRGRFREEASAVAAMLDAATGEMRSQLAFDVIAFAAGAHSWSLARERTRATILSGGRRMTGRAVRSALLFLLPQ